MTHTNMDAHDSKSPARTSKKSSRSHAPEDIGSELIARHEILGHKLDSRPVLGLDQGLVGQPVGNGLLTERRPAEEISDALSEGNLASGYVDGADKGGNVRFLHPVEFTRILVGVNKDRDSTSDKGPCSVTYMQTVRKNRLTTAPLKAKVKSKAPKKIRALEVGPDGLTMPDRLKIAMLEHAPPFHPERGGQSQLARACQAVYAGGRENAPATIQQGHIWELLNGQDSSRYLPVVAKVLGVNCLWLQFGIDPKYPAKNTSGQ